MFIGSLASLTQAEIGNVVAGSAFATLQSAGMGGYGVSVVNGAVQAGGVVIIAATALTHFMEDEGDDRGDRHDRHDDEDKEREGKKGYNHCNARRLLAQIPTQLIFNLNNLK